MQLFGPNLLSSFSVPSQSHFLPPFSSFLPFLPSSLPSFSSSPFLLFFRFSCFLSYFLFIYFFVSPVTCSRSCSCSFSLFFSFSFAFSCALSFSLPLSLSFFLSFLPSFFTFCFVLLSLLSFHPFLSFLLYFFPVRRPPPLVSGPFDPTESIGSLLGGETETNQLPSV